MTLSPRSLLHAVARYLVVMMVVVISASAFADELDIEVQTIYAKDQGEHVDPKLEPLEAQLRSTFELYSHFEHLNTHRFSLALDEFHEITLPDTESTVLSLTHKGRSQADKALLRLGLALKGKLSTEVEASPGATFFQAGLLYRDGILILAIRAE